MKSATFPRLSSLKGIGPIKPQRLLVALLLLGLGAAPGQLGHSTRAMMTDAFVQVSVFVAATLLLFYGAERLFRFDIGRALSGAKMWQVPMAALLGATPGCGGAVVVVAAYASGNVGFGAVVATLTATMGDAAFLLIATKPQAAAVVLPLSFCVGIVSGWLIDRFVKTEYRSATTTHCEVAPLIGRVRLRDVAYLLAVVPGLFVGAMQLGQVQIDAIGPVPVQAIALIATALMLMVWVSSPVEAMTHSGDAPITRMTEETSFISVWVIGAYILYEYVDVFAGIDLAAAFSTVAPLLPLVAIAVGFIPGCGPQVLVATLYLNGALPFAALIGNAISNDGDALFPAIALTPRAAFMATFWSSIPALVVAYGFYFLAPGFMN